MRKELQMQDSGIVAQVVRIDTSDRKTATHFALCNGAKLRYLIDLYGGKKRLSKNISTYSKKLTILMRILNILPFSVLSILKLGCFVKVELHIEVEGCRENAKKKHWNMIVGTYDEKQKIVLQCFDQNEPAVFIKVGNEATETEMNTEISFLRKKNRYESFEIPKLLSSTSRSDGATFNIQMTKEFVGGKVKPLLTQEIVDIYRELSKDTKDGLEFSHGDFAPWNLKKNGGRYTLFDWEHCDYRIPGFDLMHFATIVEVLLNGKNMEEAMEIALEKIRAFDAEFEVDKTAFAKEFHRIRQ